MKKTIGLVLAIMLCTMLFVACGKSEANKPAETGTNVQSTTQSGANTTDTSATQETQQQQTPAPSEPEPTVEPMKEFVLGGSIYWEDEEIIKNILMQYVGNYQNSDSKRLYIDGSDYTYYVRPPKIGGFECDMEVHTFNDGDDVFTNKFLVEVDSRLTIECEGRAGHYAEGVVITFVFEDGTVTVTCGDETMTFTQSDKQQN